MDFKVLCGRSDVFVNINTFVGIFERLGITVPFQFSGACSAGDYYIVENNTVKHCVSARYAYKMYSDLFTFHAEEMVLNYSKGSLINFVRDQLSRSNTTPAKQEPTKEETKMKKQKRIAPSTNKLVIEYTDGSTYTVRTLQEVRIRGQKMYIKHDRVHKDDGITVKSSPEIEVDLKLVEFVTLHPSQGGVRKEFSFKDGVVEDQNFTYSEQRAPKNVDILI